MNPAVAMARLVAAGPDTPGIHRFELPLPADWHPLAWLAGQRRPRAQWYWRDRDEALEFAAFGAMHTLGGDATSQPGDLTATLAGVALHGAAPRACWLMGGAFPVPRLLGRDEWRGWPRWQATLPAVEAKVMGAERVLACNLWLAGDPVADTARRQALLTTLRRLRPPDAAPLRHPTPEVLTVRDTPGQAAWNRAVQHALSAIAAGTLSKIVLARRRRLHLAAAPNPLTLLAHLRDQAPRCFHFLYQPTPEAAFLGASPELLYRRHGRHLETEALAGTRPRGETPASDDALGQALLHSAKDRAEHQLVLDSLREWLTPHCRRLSAARELALFKLPRVQHLWRPVRAELHPGVSDGDLLALLHPTPAVGGTPRDRALTMLGRLENFDRGWYASPVGWVGVDQASFCVAIRSALWRRRRLSLFAGAGLVAGSTARDEWDEVETKLTGLRAALLGS